jgi:hypothetical protein
MNEERSKIRVSDWEGVNINDLMNRLTRATVKGYST